MEKLLFITPELPYPPHSGGKVKSLMLLHALAERYDVKLACPLKGEDELHVQSFQQHSPCVYHLFSPLNNLVFQGGYLYAVLTDEDLNPRIAKYEIALPEWN